MVSKMKKILSIIAFLAVALTARAECLYWMADTLEREPDVPFWFAMIAVSGDGVVEGTYLNMANSDPTSPMVLNSVAAAATTDEGLMDLGTETIATYADLGEYSGSAYSFMVEFYVLDGDNDVKMVAQSALVNYSDLSRFIYSDIPQSGVLEAYRFTAVIPEPTGGMLFLVGLGVLALRRKRG